MRRKQRQLELDFRARGGKRRGAGRKPKGEKAEIAHAVREEKKRHEPSLVTVRLAAGLPSLQRADAMQIALAAVGAASNRHGMRLIHYSVQSNHLHLLVEADDRASVARGMNALLSPLARALNKLWGRCGQVFPQRYHDEAISTPAQARNALRYVLQNGKKHGHVPRSSIDLCSSAPAFDGWKQRPSIPATPIATLAPPSVWLLTTGWRRHGLISLDELPRRNPAESRRPERSR
jgi:REP element-mobilizing transposase RayT